MTLRRWILVCAVLFALLSVVTASAAPKEITFWVMPNAPDETHTVWLNKVAQEFQAQTGVKVNWEIVGWDTAWSRIAAAIATGEGADVSQVGTTWNPQFAATGGLEEINIAEFGGASAFMKANLDSTTYKGRYYGVPWFAETRCLFYNKDMFAAAKVNPPQTYDEVITVGKAITKALGPGKAFAMAGTNAWDLIHNWAIILWANGGDLVDVAAKKAIFNSEAGVQAMRWYVSLVENGLADKACAEYNQPQADAAFINGNVAMCFMGPWNIANIEQENPTLNYGVVEPPKGSKGRAAFSGGSNLVIFKASKNKDAAKAWIKFLLEKEKMVDYTQHLSHMLPATLAAYDDPYYSTGVWKTFKTALGYATAYPPLAVWGDIENAIVSEFKNVLSDYIVGKYKADDVKRYLDAAAKKVDEALQREK
ncbi:MAG TPA: extracellular solute-binding protein [Firmicutes bacterium]|nr:extracellular solute-binding protein [Bacillota bacterium]